MIQTMLAIHILSAVFWVGGMAFAYMILRPAAGPLEPAVRLPLWRGVFSRFLPWVGVAIVALLASGVGMVFSIFGGFADLPVYVEIMMGTGILMMLLYLHLVFAPWKRFRTALDGGALPAAAASLNRIRITVGINLVLGAITIIIGSTGRYW